MFKIYDGRDTFYQWDLDRKLIVYDETIKEVHFCNRADDNSLVCEVYKDGDLNLVNVPNILLQDNWRINVYAYDKTYTKHSQRFDVKSRTKPADYVYTETEVKKWDDLAERISALEQNGGSGVEPFITHLTIGEDGKTIVADKSSIDAIEAYKAGRPVYCEYGAENINFVFSVIQYFEDLGTVLYGNVLMRTAQVIFHYSNGNIITQSYSLIDENELQDTLLPITNRIEELEQNGGSSGSNVFTINITNNDGTYTADKTYQEIRDALDEGKQLQCKYKSVIYPFIEFSILQQIEFGAVVSGTGSTYFENIKIGVGNNIYISNIHWATIDSTNNRYNELYSSINSLTSRVSTLESNSDIFRVNIQPDGNGGYIADKTATEAIQAAAQGNFVQAALTKENDETKIYALNVAYIDIVNFVVAYTLHMGSKTISILQTGYVAEVYENQIGAPQQMELIASGTNTEPIRRFKITVDNDGIPFELTRATFVVANASAEPKESSYRNSGCHVKLGDEIIAPVYMYDDTGNREVIVYTDADAGLMLVAQGGGGIYNRGNAIMATGYTPNNVITEAIFETADATEAIAAGATYELWGIRK